jgi:hypothetical protein
LRLLVERRVGQLDFRDFAATTSLNSNIVNAGNENLEPARSWIVSLTWERQFWERGALMLEARQEHISHVVDRVPVFSGASVFDAVGNIGSGRRDVMEASLILPLDRIGLDGVTVKGSGTLLASRVRDPATGAIRAISGDQRFSTQWDVTYDLPRQDLRLGVSYHDHGQTPETEYRIDEVVEQFHQVKLGAFVEYKPAPGWTVRLYGDDLGQTAFYRNRFIYAGLRGVAPLDLIERRSLGNGALFGVRIQHEFQ